MMKSMFKPCLLAISLVIVCVFTQVSAFAAAPVIKPIGRIGGIPAPTRVDVDRSGNIYVADAQGGELFKFDMYGRQLFRVKHEGVTGGGLAVSPDGSVIYLSAKTRVYKLDGNGAIVGAVGAGVGEFMAATFLELDEAGYLFVADGGTRFVKVYDANGVYRYSFGSDGPAARVPYGSITSLALDKARRFVHVSDSIYPQKIFVHDYAGNRKYVNAFSRFGSPYVIYFGNIAFDTAGRGYLLGMLQGHLRTFTVTATGMATLASTYNVRGHQAGGLVRPSDVTYDPLTARLFVTCEGSRVEVFGIDGGQMPVRSNEPPATPVPVAPAGGIEVKSTSVDLTVGNQADPDGDVLQFEVELTGPEGVVSRLLSADALVASALVENATYSWRVRAFDGEEYSAWSLAEAFVVNAVNEAPSAAPLSQLAGSSIDGSGILAWSGSTDPDPNDSVAYRYEIASDGLFTSVVAAGSAASEVVLKDVSGYPALEDGAQYFWRVVAVDEGGLETPSVVDTFVYDTIRLAVSANIPGSKVYLGATPGVAGDFFGVTPVEVRDLKPGVVRGLISKPGFAPYYFAGEVSADGDVVVSAELVPAVVAGGLKSAPLNADAAKIVLGGQASVAIADMNLDGLQDLILGDSLGNVQVAAGTVVDAAFAFGKLGHVLSAPVSIHSIAVRDMDGDGDLDMVLGIADGTVVVAANSGTASEYRFGSLSPLTVAGVPVAVGSFAAPAFYDFNNDGSADLVVGSGSGELNVFLRSGAGFVASSKVVLQGLIVPAVADLDGDAEAELLVSTGSDLAAYTVRDGMLQVEQVLVAAGDLEKNGTANKGKGAHSAGSGIKPAAFDVDGQKGCDLIVGLSTGEVRILRSFGDSVNETIVPSLVELAESIQALAGAPVAEFDALLAEMFSQNYTAALLQAQALGAEFSVLVDVLEMIQ